MKKAHYVQIAVLAMIIIVSLTFVSRTAVKNLSLWGINQLAAVGDIPGLQNLWTMDEGSGTSLGDTGGGGINGTLSNGPVWSTDKMVGTGALQFDGVDDGVSLGSPQSMQGLSAFSVGGWVKMTGNVNNIQTFISKFNGNWQNGPFILWYVGISAKLIFTVHTSLTNGVNAHYTWPETLASDGKWHHIMGTYDGSTVKIYVDGTPGTSANTSGPTITGADVAWLGRSGGMNDYFKGNLDDFRFYNRALTEEEVGTIVTAGGGTVGAPVDPGGGGGTPPGGGGSTPPADTTAPSVTNNTASILSAGTTQIIMSVSTDETATCAYSTDSTKTYATMTAFTTTGGSTHSSTISGLTNGGSYTYYVKCRDTAGNVSGNTSVVFSVRAAAIPPPANATIIDSSALISFPTSALWNSIINFRPGNGEVVTLNPPAFSWPYVKNIKAEVGDGNCANGIASIGCAPKEFVFQIARSEADLRAQTNLVENVRTPINSYNTLKPLSAGSTYYWWVGYIKPKNTSSASSWTLQPDSWESQPYTWSTVRSFTVSSGATTWDRSGLVNPTVSHPYVLINPSNRAGLLSWLNNMEANYMNAGTSLQRKMANTWNDVKNRAKNYSSPSITDVQSALAAYPKIRDAGLVWQLTTGATGADGTLHAAIEAKKPWEDLVKMAEWFITSKTWEKDTDVWVSDAAMTRSFGYSYDWWYEKMDDTQRATVRRAIDAYVGHRMGTLDGFNYSALKEFPTSYWVAPYSQYITSTSHQWIDTEVAIIPALATFSESVTAKKFFDFATNYLVSHPIFFAGGSADGPMNLGRGYSGGELRKYKILQDAIAYQIAFPGQRFNLVPWWKNNADWWMATTPNYWTQYRDPWGDGGAGKDGHGASLAWGRDAAYFLNDGTILQYHNNERDSLYSGSPYQWYRDCAGSCVEDFEEPIIQYYAEKGMYGLNVPSPTTQTKRNFLFMNDGWATGCSGTINTSSCFNGLGFIFRASPGNGLGSTRGHNNPASLAYQLWAYGSPITDAGDIGLWGYPRYTDGQYGIVIDGLGEWQTPWGPDEPVYARFYAKKEGSNYTYYAADATRAYAHNVNNIAGLSGGYDFINGPHAHVQKVRRHFLFVKNKYFVTFDELQASRPSTYSMIYHIPWLYHKTGTSAAGWITTSSEDKFKFGPTQTQFSYVAGNIPVSDYDRGPMTEVNVPVHVMVMSDPSLVTVQDQSGTKVRTNPFTQKDHMSNGDQYPRPHTLWISNTNKATTFNFLTVIYPQRPGGSAPKLERIDDFTARVTNDDGTVDVISFNPDTAGDNGATMLVDVSELTPLPFTDDVTGSTVLSAPYVPPQNTPVAPSPVNGVCSTTINMCTAGTFADQADTATAALWQCTGINGGTTASCTVAQTTVYKPGDFNKDGVVNTIDYSLMAGAWNTSNATYDLTKDGSVNTLDYAIMVKNWTS